jgi:cell division septation protein DedD
MPRPLRDEDKIVERTETPGFSKRALIILGTVVYVLGIASGVRIASVMGVGVCPTTPAAGPASLPAPKPVAPAPQAIPQVPLPVPGSTGPRAAPAATPDASLSAPTDPAPPVPALATPPAVIAATPGQVYAIQVKSFADLEEAGDLARQLKEAGYPAFVVSTTLPDKGEMHRVRIGEYPSRAAAEAAATDLEEKTGLTSFVTVSLD